VTSLLQVAHTSKENQSSKHHLAVSGGSITVCSQAICGELVMAMRDVISLNRMITGFIRDGLGDRAHAVYRWMVSSGFRETPHTFAAILSACNSCEGMQLHGRVLALGLCSNPFIGSALVNLYMRIGMPCAALLLYDETALRSTVISNVFWVACAI